MFSRARPRMAVFSHIIPPDVTEAQLLEATRPHYDGPADRGARLHGDRRRRDDRRLGPGARGDDRLREDGRARSKAGLVSPCDRTQRRGTREPGTRVGHPAVRARSGRLLRGFDDPLRRLLGGLASSFPRALWVRRRAPLLRRRVRGGSGGGLRDQAAAPRARGRRDPGGVPDWRAGAVGNLLRADRWLPPRTGSTS